MALAVSRVCQTGLRSQGTRHATMRGFWPRWSDGKQFPTRCIKPTTQHTSLTHSDPQFSETAHKDLATPPSDPDTK